MSLSHISLFSFKHFRLLSIVVPLLVAAPSAAFAIDLIPAFLKREKVNRTVWENNEQYVRIVPQDEAASGKPRPNDHPVHLAQDEVRDVLRSLELWVEGGFFRDDEAVRVFDGMPVNLLAQYIVEGLGTAKPGEDVTFNVRGYGKVAFDVAKERFWTAGRVFFVDGKLNLIIGSYQLKKDKGIRNAEAAHGVLEDYRLMPFAPGSRAKQSKMPGRIVSIAGVTPHDDGSGARPDWVEIDVARVVADYRDSLIPAEEKKRDQRLKAEAAKLTLERRQMREEMARLRKELNELKRHGSSAESVEERLATLQKLRDSEVISEQEFQQRRAEILKDI
jgi:hypothetical protein